MNFKPSTTTAPKPKPSPEQVKLENDFYRLMFEKGLYTKFDDTYKLFITEQTSYGFKGLIYLEAGLSFEQLRENIGVIQENLCCIFILETQMFQQYANVKIVTVPMDEKFPYKCPEDMKPYEMHLGVDFTGTPIKIDCNRNCQYLLAGATNAGKTRFLAQLLLSWVIGCKPNEVAIYLGDCAKNEYINFQYVKHIKYYANEFDELLLMVRCVWQKLGKRKAVISKLREQGLATNIEEYNKLNESTKMAYLYVVIDEFSILMPDKSDTDEDAKIKEKTLDIIKKLCKIGRSYGIFIVLATQKCSRDELPSICKNMAAVRISFKANDSVSSEVILGDGCAVGLPNRYALYSLNGGEKRDYLYSPYITTETLKALLKPHEDKTKKKVLDLEEEPKTENSATRTLPKKTEKKKIEPTENAGWVVVPLKNKSYETITIKDERSS